MPKGSSTACLKLRSSYSIVTSGCWLRWSHSVVDAVRGRAKITKICPDGSFSVLRAIVVALLLGRS
eukprot:scaffold137334_cov118-Phaeocystis_antarctica.AAC.1